MIKHKQKGFTLIELMLVIGIITLLSSVLFYNVTEAKKKAEDAAMKVETDQVKKAITLYKEDNGFVPYNTNASGAQIYKEEKTAGETSDYEKIMGKLVPQYISEIPHSPSGTSYAYGYNDDYTSGLFMATLNYEEKNNKSGSNNSCGFVESRINLLWSGFDIIKSDSGLATSYCNNDLYPYKCYFFTTKENGKSLLKSLCDMEYSTDSHFDNYKSNSWTQEAACNFEVNYRFQPYSFYQGLDDTLFFQIDNSEDPALCSGSSNSDFCQCI